MPLGFAVFNNLMSRNFRALCWVALAALTFADVIELSDKTFDERLSSDNKNWWINFHSSFCGAPCDDYLPVLKELDQKLGEHLHIATIDHLQDLVQRFDIQFYPTSIYIRQSVQPKQYYVYDGNRSVDAITFFAAGDFKLSVPHDLPEPMKMTSLVTRLNDTTFDKNVMRKHGAYWAVLFCDKEVEACETARLHYEGMAKLLRGRVNHALVMKKSGKKTFARFGVTSVPALFVVRGGQAHKYNQSALNSEDMQQFVDGGFQKIDGVKIEVLPEVQEQLGDVIVLTDANFDSETKAMSPSSTTTWFIEFYAPWCGHCKALAPTWESLATHMKHKMKVAKVDCTANKNTSERFQIPGFPSLLLFRHGKFWKYDGKLKTEEALVAWALMEYNQGENKDGWPVPPPIGQPAPPLTWADLAHTSIEDLKAFYQFYRPVTIFLVGSGAALGGGSVAYCAIVWYLVKLAAKAGNRVAEGNQKRQVKKNK